MKDMFVIFLVFFVALPLSAQDKPLPPPRDFQPETRQVRDVLPTLLLPEYVITGSDMISFIQDRKGEVSEPDSHEFSARAGRGEREQRFVTTVPSHMPLRKPDLTGSSEVLRLRAGFGAYSTPRLEAWYADRYPEGDAMAHFAYERSNGHVPHADYSHFNAGFSGGSYLPRNLTPLLASSRLQGDMQFQVSDYGLYADRVLQEQPVLDFRRTSFGLSAGMDLQSRNNQVLDHDVRLSFAHLAVDEALGIRDTLALDEYRQMENLLALDASARHRIAGHQTSFGLQLHVNDLSERMEESTRPFYMSSDAKMQFDIGERTRLEGSAAMYLYRGSDHASQFRLYPSLLLHTNVAEHWSLFGGWLPEVREQTLSGFLRMNPYMMLASNIRHTDLPLRFRAGADYDNRRQSSARVFVEYLSSTSWPRFGLLDDPVRQQWEMRYDGRASIVHLNLELAHAFSKRTRVQLSTEIRTSSLDGYEGRIPYLPDYETRVLLTHSFPFGLRVQTTVQLVGEQEADGGALPAWMLLGLDLEYRIGRNFGVFLHLDNLLDQSWQRWPGYRERPFFMMAGISTHI
ncbi:MAG: hypothetical protein KFH87_06730 [Bacteroidetes bacterium]|nr:hypothetical protein [Bacteroidota bacterium]